ncbi:hypothetical protein PDQ34_21015 [Bacillus cereus]|nr:hypothetical protein [Bacillus cereus]MDA2571545.1 hypothetical protein [Bacillus cereus]
MKFLGEKLFEKWMRMSQEVRIFSLLLAVSVMFFVNFFLPGIKAVKMLFTHFREMDTVSLIIAIISSLFILRILGRSFVRKK